MSSSFLSFLAAFVCGEILLDISKLAVDNYFYIVFNYNFPWLLPLFFFYSPTESSFGPNYLSNLSVLTNTNIIIEAINKQTATITNMIIITF